MSGSYDAGGEPSVSSKLADKGLEGYDPQRVYNALDAMFAENDSSGVNAALVDPLEYGIDRESAEATDFDDEFKAVMDAYDSNEGEPVRGYDIANTFVESEDYEESRDALELFDDWTQEIVPRLHGGATVFVGDTQLNSDEYEHAVRFYSLRELVQRRQQYHAGDADLFNEQGSGRDIDIDFF